MHGRAPTAKREGVIRLLYENVNGLNNRMSGNEKLDRGKEMIDELEADVVAMNEIRINFNHRKNVNGLAQLFNGGEVDVRAYKVATSMTELSVECKKEVQRSLHSGI